MRWSDTAACIAAIERSGVPHGPEAPFSIIEDESDWRHRPNVVSLPSNAPAIVTTRWRSHEHRMREVSAETPADHYVISIVLRNENVRLSMSGRVVHDGIAMPGMVHVTEPAVSARCVFRGPYDVLHLHVPHSLIAEFDRGVSGFNAPVLAATLTRDPLAEPLGRALLEADEIGGSFGQLYADGVGHAILARLLSLSHQTGPVQRPKVSALAKWRLKRAIDYIEARFAEQVTLADIAAAAGLTRMHFAAQFRAATGLRPHEYLLRRRIEHAQEMLAATLTPVVDVALSVGFQTQSQFTTVFKRFTGQPPNAWRHSHRDETIAPNPHIDHPTRVQET
jgi:AraC family transcriptional regulator